ncbi:MAG: large-conductance mechanosensitive channel protein MscL [Clostridia bacterium]|nr:large-conductance mechanosensitive channel protein MscL [Clostridia bacterium]MDI9511783.1 large-conductance mechanosensitive channel protein MscL [Bacillota bacterium]
MSMWKEFKDFALKGNVVDLAVGVIIGSAFGKIVTSLVNDMIMPMLGRLTGNIDLTAMEWVINDTTDPVLSMKYGQFLQNVLDFLIISFTIFLAIRLLSKLKKKEEKKPEPPKPSKEELLLTEIRDILKGQIEQLPS